MVNENKETLRFHSVQAKKADNEGKVNTESNQEDKVVTEVCCTKEDHGNSPFGAIFLISLGVIFLLNNFNLLPWSVWGSLWRFWPLFLILGGLQLVLGKSYLAKWIVAILGLLIIAIVVCLSIPSLNTNLHNYLKSRFSWWPESSVFNISRGELKEDQTVVVDNDYQGVTNRKLTIDIGVSEFNLTDDNTYNYLSVNSSYYDDFGKPKLEKNFKNGVLSLDFSTQSSGFFFGRLFDSNKVKYDFSLGQTGIPTDIDINLGTGKGVVTFDKSNLNIFKAKVGTGSLNLTFSKYALPSGKITLDVGTGSINVSFPKEIGLKITHEIGTGNIKIDNKDLDNDGTFTSENYDSTSTKVDMDVDVGTGSVEVVTE